MRTITAYGIAVIIVFAILNGIFWLVGNPRLHERSRKIFFSAATDTSSRHQNRLLTHNQISASGTKRI
jgi:hypothetical protein